MKKLTLFIMLTMIAILVYMACSYYYIQISNRNPNDKIKLLTIAADNFMEYGFMICAISWLIVNIAAVVTKQLAWLLVPFIFTVIVTFLMSYYEEDMFLFKKTNGMWKGGFSMSYFVGVGIVIITAITILINYIILKSSFKKQIK